MNSIEKFEITNLKIGYIVDKIDNNEIALPDLQRPFVWNTTKVRDLFDSLYKGLPIGVIILWEINKPIDYTKINFNDFKSTPNLLIIDGQQRLTSLYSIIKDKEIVSKNTKRIKLKSDLDLEEVSDIFIRINSKGEQLNESDFILTLLSVYSPQERDLEKKEISNELRTKNLEIFKNGVEKVLNLTNWHNFIIRKVNKKVVYFLPINTEIYRLS